MPESDCGTATLGAQFWATPKSIDRLSKPVIARMLAAMSESGSMIRLWCDRRCDTRASAITNRPFRDFAGIAQAKTDRPDFGPAVDSSYYRRLSYQMTQKAGVKTSQMG